jgi:hypothetical protein
VGFPALPFGYAVAKQPTFRDVLVCIMNRVSTTAHERGTRFQIAMPLRWMAFAPLARTSHQLSAAVGDAQHPAAFSRFGVLTAEPKAE